MKLKTTELQGSALDWAVAQAEGNVRLQYDNQEGLIINNILGWIHYCPSAAWQQGGPIIEREKIELVRGNDLYFPKGNENGEFYEPLWIATRTEGPAVSEARGPTPLIAAMRCYVASQLGDEVEVPDELA
jgi:hypothetical protein